MSPSIALTPGEPAGIGPDLAVLCARQPRDERIVVVADKQLLADRAEQLKLPLTLIDYSGNKADIATQKGELSI